MKRGMHASAVGARATGRLNVMQRRTLMVELCEHACTHGHTLTLFHSLKDSITSVNVFLLLVSLCYALLFHYTDRLLLARKIFLSSNPFPSRANEGKWKHDRQIEACPG